MLVQVVPPLQGTISVPSTGAGWPPTGCCCKNTSSKTMGGVCGCCLTSAEFRQALLCKQATPLLTGRTSVSSRFHTSGIVLFCAGRDLKTHLTDCASLEAAFACNLQHCAIDLLARFIKESALLLNGACQADCLTSLKDWTITANATTAGMLAKCYRQPECSATQRLSDTGIFQADFNKHRSITAYMHV